ncbi:hypothetical protein [Kineococcus aurantiacus]|uniref:hypothetical protein n=1 Tax=Kineococcus aurantiacus TaxID=37633 RepID=UPI0031E112ED
MHTHTHRALTAGARIAATSYATLTLLPWATDWLLEGTPTLRTGLLLAAVPFTLLFGALAAHTAHQPSPPLPLAAASPDDDVDTTLLTTQVNALTGANETMLTAPTRAGPPTRTHSTALPQAKPLNLIKPAGLPADHPARHLHLTNSATPRRSAPPVVPQQPPPRSAS